MLIRVFKEKINNGAFDDTFSLLYGTDPTTSEAQRSRFLTAVDRFSEIFAGQDEVRFFSAPGRTEIGGNHTDHQHGCALAAAVSLDIIAAAALSGSDVIRVYSEGYGMTEVRLNELSDRVSDHGKPSGLIRGIAARFADMGVQIRGFDAYLTSDVLGGSGLSSSAAFETLIAVILNTLFNGSVTTAPELARIGQYSENVYFGKNSGLLDQTACSVGGLVFIDFLDPGDPIIKSIDFDFEAAGYTLCITDTKGSHADLTSDYAAVPGEMSEVAGYFGCDVLRRVDEDEFFNSIPLLRDKCSDRSIMRAVHFFEENKRAQAEAQALVKGDLDIFFELYRESAQSSAFLLQNLYSASRPTEQGIPFAIMLSRIILGDDALVRVHGGGFAGTIQAFVPQSETAAYVSGMEAVFGVNSCYVMRIRPVGGIEIKCPEVQL